jgi:hypothetical protein
MSTDDVGEQSIMTLGLRYSPASPFVRKVLVFDMTEAWMPGSYAYDSVLGWALIRRSGRLSTGCYP